MKVLVCIISDLIILAIFIWYIRWIIKNYYDLIDSGYSKGAVLTMVF